MFEEHYRARISALKLDIAHIENKLSNPQTSSSEANELKLCKARLKGEIENYLIRIYES